jgi:N-acetylglutamate synthase-like GNAT family acetyltransferase
MLEPNAAYLSSKLSKIQILVYEPQYQTQVIELILKIQQQEFGLRITLDDQTDLLNISKFYQQGNGNFWTAIDIDTKKVIGTIAAIDMGNSQLALRKMFVDASYRGRVGAGKQLLSSLLIWAREKNVKKIYLGTIEKFKAAHKFYGKNGFSEINQSDLPATFPLMQGDTKFYKLSLE